MPTVIHIQFLVALIILREVSTWGDVMSPLFYPKCVRVNASDYKHVLYSVVLDRVCLRSDELHIAKIMSS